MAKQTEQVIFTVIIIAITMHEGLEMDLLILHARQKQPRACQGEKHDDVGFVFSFFFWVFLLSEGWLW